jgi:uncharacterized membrane protein
MVRAALLARNWIMLAVILGLSVGVMLAAIFGTERQMIVLGGLAVLICVALIVFARGE